MSKKKKANSLPPMRARASTIAEFPAPPPPGSRTPSKPPRGRSSRPPPKTRDPLMVVREAIGELDFLDSAQAAAGICAGALTLGLGARAVVIHAHDSKAKKIRIVAARGPTSEADSLMGMSTSVDDDVVASTVVEMAVPMTLKIDPAVGLPRHAPERLRAIGAQREVVAVPALFKERVVAIIEVVDAHERTASSVEAAAEYAATQLAGFLERRKKR